MDLCEKVEEVDLKCPLEAGKLTITKDVELPAQIPPVRLSQSRKVMSKPTDTMLITSREHTMFSQTCIPMMMSLSPASRRMSISLDQAPSPPSKFALTKRHALIRHYDNHGNIMNQDEAPE